MSADHAPDDGEDFADALSDEALDRLPDARYSVPTGSWTCIVAGLQD